MDDVWLAAPHPAMRLWPDGDAPRFRINAAAQRWSDSLGPFPGVWGAIAAELIAAQRAGAANGRLQVASLAWESVTLAQGWLVWLSPVDAAAGAPTAPAPFAAWSSTDDKLALVQELGAIGVFERDLRTGKARWDAQMFEFFDLDAAQPAPPIEVALARVHPDDRELFQREHERFLREGGRHRLRYRMVMRDGSTRDLQSLVDVRFDAEGQPLMMTGVIVDDTDGARRVREQEAISAHLAKALRLARISVCRIDTEKRRIHFNDVGYEMLGIAPRPDGIDLDELRSTAHPDDRARLIAAAVDATGTAAVIDVEARYKDGRGGFLHLLTRRVAEHDEHGRVVGLLGITLDQTATLNERARTQALARRIELVAEAAGLGIWSIDLESDALEWNAQMFRIYGVPPDQAPASARAWLRELIHPLDRAAGEALRERARQASEASFETQFRIVRPDGGVRWIVSRSRCELHDGQSRLVGIHLDATELVTQRERAEQAVYEKQLALRASHAKSEFLARVSHELRTPLNAVLGFAQLLEQDGAAAPAALQLERVARIRSAGEHLLALVDDVLDLAAVEAGDLPIAMEPVPVDPVLTEVAQWLAVLARDAGVTLHVQASGAWVQADARRLRQIVLNLVSNAIKFNRAAGHVWLSVQPAGEAAAGGWAISVRDDGRGLTPVQHERLFEAFNRLGAERSGIEGVGLGLTIARRLAEFMGGRIDVSSAPGEGSEFRVGLHAAVPLPSVARVVPPAEPPADARQAAPSDALALTVLYIEDNEVNMILVQQLVAMRPAVTLHCAEDGASGVAAALASPPDVVLVDMQLPDFDGFEVQRRLRAEPALAHCVLVALSANTLSEDIARARAAGFDDYWTKPIDVKHFLAGLDGLVAQTRSSSARASR